MKEVLAFEVMICLTKDQNKAVTLRCFFFKNKLYSFKNLVSFI